MREWFLDGKKFLSNTVYRVMLLLSAIGSYGFFITHGTVGIDDTPYSYYFKDGLSAVVGRWVTYMLGKVLHITEFAPFFTDLAGVLLLMCAAVVWTVVLYRIFGERIPMWGYGFFGALLISNPLISEVFTYFLHNGVGLGYLFSGISLAFLKQYLDESKKKWQYLLCSALGLWIAIGCYESFMIVYLMAVCMLLASERIAGNRAEKGPVKQWFGEVIPVLAAAAIAFVLRSVMVNLVITVFGLQELKDDAVHRSLSEMLGWIFDPEGRATFVMALKRTYVRYFAFLYAYYPIFIYVCAAVFVGVYSVYRAIRQKKPWILIWTIGAFIASYLLVVIEGSVTLYRSAQFLPLFSAWGILLGLFAVSNVRERISLPKGKKLVERAVAVVLSVVLINQCADMNRWFYIDYLKYEDAKNTMNQIAYELEKNYDTSKPVIFTGTYYMPKSIIKDAYVEYHSETFYKILRWTNPVDEHLLEKFYNGHYGVWVAQTPGLSVLDWARYAFDDDTQMTIFFSMHGHTVVPQKDTGVYADAETYALDMPSFPEEGSIEDMGDYIIVHF